MQHLFGFGSSLHAQRNEEELRGQRSINQSLVRGSVMHTHTHTTLTLSLSLQYKPNRAYMNVELVAFEMEYSQL